MGLQSIRSRTSRMHVRESGGCTYWSQTIHMLRRFGKWFPINSKVGDIDSWSRSKVWSKGLVNIPLIRLLT